MRFLSVCGSTALVCGMSLCSLPAMAYQAGDAVVRLGASVMAPNDKSSPIFINDAIQRGGLPRVKVGSSAAAELGLMYMFAPEFAAELKVGTPYQQKLKGKEFDLNANGVKVNNLARARLWSPELNLQWYPMAHHSVWQPYLGAGAHYAMFSGEKVNQELLNDLAATSATLSLKNRWGWNAQLGMDWVFSDRFAVNASARYVAIKAAARGTTPGNNIVRFDLKLNPVVYTLGISYKF